MTSESQTPEKSVLEQILERVFATIAGKDEFNESIVQKLRELAASDRINNPDQVTEILKSSDGETCENS